MMKKSKKMIFGLCFTLAFAILFFFENCANTDFGSKNVASTASSGSTFSWSSASAGWSACSVPCGGGTQSQVYTCKRDDGLTVPDIFCAGSTKPTGATQSCN